MSTASWLVSILECITAFFYLAEAAEAIFAFFYFAEVSAFMACDALVILCGGRLWGDSSTFLMGFFHQIFN